MSLDYQNFDEIGDLIKVNFKVRGCDFTTHKKDPDSIFSFDMCKGIGEGMWATVLEVRKNDDFPISLTNIITAKLENQPIHQIDEIKKLKINVGDICEFEDDGFTAAKFIRLLVAMN